VLALPTLAFGIEAARPEQLNFSLRTTEGGAISSEMLRVYWVSTDSDSLKSKNYASDEQLRDFAKKNRLKIAVLRDPDGALFKRVGVPGNQLPAVVILDRAGSVHGEPVAGIDPKGDLVGQLSGTLNGLLGAQ
jgi:hypothetical protein